MHQGVTTSLLPSIFYFETLIGPTSVSCSTWQCASRRDYVITPQYLLFWNFDRSDLSKLEYLTMCIKEGLRHYSPVPFIQREFTHDFEVDGHIYPKGTSVTLHIYGLHHNKDLWDDPMSYIPERFSKDNIAKMDPFQFTPFSAGPR